MHTACHSHLLGLLEPRGGLPPRGTTGGAWHDFRSPAYTLVIGNGFAVDDFDGVSGTDGGLSCLLGEERPVTASGGGFSSHESTEFERGFSLTAESHSAGLPKRGSNPPPTSITFF